VDFGNQRLLRRLQVSKLPFTLHEYSLELVYRCMPDLLPGVCVLLHVSSIIYVDTSQSAKNPIENQNLLHATYGKQHDSSLSEEFDV
jgi:hypothetical protein